MSVWRRNLEWRVGPTSLQKKSGKNVHCQHGLPLPPHPHKYEHLPAPLVFKTLSVMVDCFTPCQQLRICNSDPIYENIWKPDSALYKHLNVWTAACVNEGDNLTRTKWERDIKKLGAESKCGEFKIYIFYIEYPYVHR